jgi:hypothetical protein
VDEDTRAMVPLERMAPAEVEPSAEPGPRRAEQLAADVVRVMDLIAERPALETPHPSTARRGAVSEPFSRDRRRQAEV